MRKRRSYRSYARRAAGGYRRARRNLGGLYKKLRESKYWKWAAIAAVVVAVAIIWFPASKVAQTALGMNKKNQAG